MLYIVQFQRRRAFSPDWSSLFGPFLGYFQIRNAIFVDFEERNTASVDVWVIFGSFSKDFEDLSSFELYPTEVFNFAIAPRREVRSDHGRVQDRPNFRGLVLGCIEAKICKKICVWKLSPRSTQCAPLHRFGIHNRKMGKKGPLSNLKISGKNCWIFCCFFPKSRKFCPNFAKFLLNFRQG